MWANSKLKKMTVFAVIFLASPGCGSGNQKLDSHNSFHCGIAFSVMLSIADDMPITSEERRQVVGRVKALAGNLVKLEAERSRNLPKSERTKELGSRIAKRLLSNSNELNSLYANCLRESRNH